MAAIINVSNSAFFSLLLEGLEAYAIKHHGKKQVAIETHATLWGKVNKRGPLRCEVKHISVDSSANKRRGSVSPSSLALTLKKDVAAMFGDDYAHLGTFHTHPWLIDENIAGDQNNQVANADSIRKNKLYNFSNGDHMCEMDSPTISVGSKNYSIALVMTIFAATKADDRKDGRIDNDLFEFSLGNVKVWLKAQVYQHKPTGKLTAEDKKILNKYGIEEYPKFELYRGSSSTLPVPVETELKVPFIEDMGYFLEKFGRLTMSESMGNYRDADEAERRWFHIS